AADDSGSPTRPVPTLAGSARPASLAPRRRVLTIGRHRSAAVPFRPRNGSGADPLLGLYRDRHGGARNRRARRTREPRARPAPVPARRRPPGDDGADVGRAARDRRRRDSRPAPRAAPPA